MIEYRLYDQISYTYRMFGYSKFRNIRWYILSLSSYIEVNSLKKLFHFVPQLLHRIYLY